MSLLIFTGSILILAFCSYLIDPIYGAAASLCFAICYTFNEPRR